MNSAKISTEFAMKTVLCSIALILTTGSWENADALSPDMYRMTVDIATVRVERGKNLDATLRHLLEETGGVRFARGGPDPVIAAVDRVSTSTMRGQRYAVAVPGHPAHLSVQTRVPYPRERVLSRRYYSTVVSDVDFVSVGSDLRVTAFPAGPGNVRVDIEFVESSSDDDLSPRTLMIPGTYSQRGDTIVSFTRDIVLPPVVRAESIRTSVIVPVGSSIVIGGAPTGKQRDDESVGGVLARGPIGSLTYRVGTGDEAYEVLMLLTVTPEFAISQKSADQLIKEFLNRPR